MGFKFSAAPTPDYEYEEAQKNWTPPSPRLVALPGFIILEELPSGSRGAIFEPEEATNNFKVIHDGYEPREGRPAFGNPDGSGYLPCGVEAIYTGSEDLPRFQHSGRTYLRVPREFVELVVTA